MLDWENLKALAIRIIQALTTFYKAVVEVIEKIAATINEKKEQLPDWPIREKAHSPYLRYGLVIVLTLLVFTLKAALGSLFNTEGAFLLFYAVIIISAWYGGTRPGLLAAGITTILAYTFYLNPYYPNEQGSNVVAALVFFMEGMLIVGLSHAMHRALQIYEEKKRYAQYYDNISQHMIDAVVSTDMNDTIQSWNKGAELLYGWRQRDVIDKPLSSIVPAIYPASVKRNIIELLSNEKRWRGEVIHQRKNGSRVYVLTSMSLLSDEEGKPLGIVSVNRDITDRKKLEQGKDDFIALASHELKTPLTSIQLYSSVLKQRLEKNNDRESVQYLSKIDTQMSKLLELVNHLLDVSKVQAGKVQFHVEEIQFDDFINEVVKDIQHITKTHTIEIQGRTNQKVLLDSDRFRQVIVNILNNAIKYSSQAQTVKVFLKKRDTVVQVSIQDFGIGIPKEKQNRIFDRFYQVDDSKGYTYSGLGLGLYISREIIEKHNGILELESEVNKGSIFTISLPIVKKQSREYKKAYTSHRR